MFETGCDDGVVVYAGGETRRELGQGSAGVGEKDSQVGMSVEETGENETSSCLTQGNQYELLYVWINEENE